MWYKGQPVECDICGLGHVARDCPVRGKCRRCLQPGHIAQNCRNPPQAWGDIGSSVGGVINDIADPTPADAAALTTSSATAEAMEVS